jgi:hypothetical protein
MKYTLLILSIFLFSCKENLNEVFSTTKQNEVVGKFKSYDLDNHPTDNPIFITKVNDTIFNIMNIISINEYKYIKKGDTLIFEASKSKKDLYYLIKGNKLVAYLKNRKISYYKKSNLEEQRETQEKLQKEMMLQEIKKQDDKANEDYQKLLNKK